MLLVVAPFWWGELDAGLLDALTPALMWLPAVAAFVATKLVVRPTSTARFLAVTSLRPVRRPLGAAAAVSAGTVLLLRVLLDVVHRPPFKQ